MALNNFGLGMEFNAKDNASQVVVGLGKQLGVLQHRAEDVNKAFDKTTDRTRDLTTGRFAAAPKGLLNTETMSQVGGQLQGIAAAAGALGIGIAGAMGYAVNEASKFQKSIAEVASITTRAAFPISEIERLGKEMASTYGGDLNMQVKALYQAASSGAANVAEASALMHSANKLAVGGLSDSFKAVDALTNVLNAYGMKMGDADKVSDAMFTTAKIGKTTIDELATQIGRVAPTAAAMGVSMDDMMSVVTAASTQLGNGTAAIDGFKEALSSVLKPTSDATAEATKLGINFSMAGIKAAGGFAKFFQSIQSNGKFTQDTIKNLWGGSMTAFNAMSALAANEGKAFTEALAGMAEKTGATTTAFNTLAETGDFAQNVLKANFQTALVNIGQVIAPVFGKVLTVLNRVVQAFNNASPTVHKITAVFAVAVAGLAFFVSGAAGAAVAIGGIIVMGKVLLIALAVVVVVMAVLAAAFVPLIAAGAFLYYAWTKNLGGITSNIRMWFAQISLAFNAVVQLLSTGELSGQVLTDLNDGNQGIKQFAINVFLWVERIKNFFKGVGEGFQTGMKAVGPIIQQVIAGFQRLLDKIVPVKQAANEARGTFNAFGAAGGKSGKFVADIIGAVATGLVKVIAFVEGLVAAWAGISPALGAVWGAVKQLFGAFKEMMGAFSGPSVNASADTWKTVGTVIGWIANFMVKQLIVGMGVLGAVFSVIGGVFGAIGTIISGVFNAIWLGIKFVWAIMTGDFKGAFQIALDMVVNWANTVTTMIGKVVGGVAGMADSLGKIFGQDLGLKASVEGFVKGIQIEKVAAPPPGGATSAPVGGTANPGVAAAQAQRPIGPPTAAQAAAVPADINVKSQLVIDGAVLAEATKKHTTAEAGRAYGPPQANT